MAQDTEETRLFRFRKEVEAVLTAGEDGNLWVVQSNCHRFFVVGPGKHPANGEDCLIGEFYAGGHDGLRFYLEPGWERPEWWGRVAEDA
jgi:hypothetical protein